MAALALKTVSAQRPLVLLGCGNMGRALLKGWLDRGLSRDHLFIADPALEDGLPALGIGADRAGGKAPEGMTAGILMLAVKPQILQAAAPGIAGLVDAETTLLSIMAGVDIARMSALLPGNGGVVRTMPNTPAAIGKGVTGLFAQADVSASARADCNQLMQAAGATVWVDAETDLNAVTAVSGSGPAYVFHMIECLAVAGQNEGLSADVARTLAVQTVYGAGALAAAGDDTPEQLRINVTSPGGTTQAGLDVLMRDDQGLKALVIDTVRAARKRAEELAG